MPEVVGRLAPSPTGRLHLGHARSFLLAWWSARSRGGRVVVRIEDLDATRVKPGAVDLVLEDLAWLGLDWDGEPLLQSTRKDAHDAAIADLAGRGLAYPCICTRREIEEAASAPHADGGETPYPGTCSGRFASAEEARARSGRDPAMRLRVPTGSVEVVDGVLGTVDVDVAAAAGDFVIARKDGSAAYQLATPLDDAFQGVTEVVRGDDLVPSAARQHLVCEALGLDVPAQFHVPLVHEADGRRLAKRAGSLSLQELRAAGARSEEVVLWAARVSGLGGAECPAPAAAWLDGFRWERVPTERVLLEGGAAPLF
ncbi:MAG: tRNA glutamyl-Q(34) synthetase GluQRS [Planctomycetota bacterium]